MSGLILVNSFARLVEALDYPWGRAPVLEEELLDVMRAGWGRGVLLDLVAPSKVGDERLRQWWARYQRLGSSPGVIVHIRAGIHTGEVELADGAVRGVAVHIGQRVLAGADPGGVLVSSTVKDLVAGSGLVFAYRGGHVLKGVPGQWRLYEVQS